ncbi:MAG: methionyl-tRNA formyltransferase [Candidatus Magasanikbacteria bacterium CG_4_9_14_3_um_filter_32_9]|uniref:Methionyl-tRNA formyltransferase n=1 Tax=Candidatus Magasanikbacteria bacterium CG_4_9_14_3_um_filter_32_9 TaxID=1974644 RepID=A0A2M7Z6X7_9BACT|nr:MAG: methionyl-tRNA formyltransferase [Candidatus Magasanikbacteria bacterium CG_4_9_14_3_um_filter_32_9]
MKESKIKIIFFGTHNFAVKILKGLLEAPFISVVKVVTQPDRPAGRKKVMTPPPVKVFALENGLEIIQPESLKTADTEDFKADIGITAQYGLIIPNHILEAPTHGILNVHTSLLPKYRGASPIQTALINGDNETGITIMQMSEGLDEGAILKQEKLEIETDDTYLDLDKKLAQIGAKIIAQTAKDFIDGNIVPQEQDSSKATFCRQLERKNGKIDWSQNNAQIYNLYRGLTPWPGISTSWEGKNLKLLKIKPSKKEIPIGKVLAEGKQIFIGTGDKSIEILELQLEGKNIMDASTFSNGFKIDGTQLL